MKRIVASLLCISLIFAQYKHAEAAVPVAVAAVAVGSALLVAAGATSYYSNPSGASAVATAGGQVYSNVTAYTQAVSALGQGYLISQSAALKASMSDIIAASKDAAAGIADTLKGLLNPPLDPSINPFKTGDVISVGSTNYQLGDLITEGWTGTPTGSGWQYMGNNIVKHTGPLQIVGGYPTYKVVSYYATPTSLPASPVPTAPPLTPEQATVALSGSAGGGSISPTHAREINNLIGSGALSASGVSVSGTTTGDVVTGDDKNMTLPPYVPPATLPGTSTPITPTPVLPTTTTGLGSATTTAAQQNVTTSQQQVTTVEQQLAADPTNTDLQQQLVAAQQALAAAQAALDHAKAAEDEVYVNPLFPNRKTLNLESWRQLVNVLPSKFPFNLVTTLGSYFEPFLADPVAPAFELHIYQDKKLNIDLSVFDTPVAIFRWGLALLLTFGMVQLLIRWWKGTA